MGSTKFTEEQIDYLNQNPFVYKVTPSRLYLTKDFKELFYSDYQDGYQPAEIFSKYGLDPNIIGEQRVWSMSFRIRKEYESNGEFREGYNRKRIPRSGDNNALSEKEELKVLRQKVEYIEQEIAFLKKISSIKNTRK